MSDYPVPKYPFPPAPGGYPDPGMLEGPTDFARRAAAYENSVSAALMNRSNYKTLHRPNKYMRSPMHPDQIQEALKMTSMDGFMDPHAPAEPELPAPNMSMETPEGLAAIPRPMDMDMLRLNPPVELEFDTQPAMQALAKRRMMGQRPVRPFTPEELALMLGNSGP